MQTNNRNLQPQRETEFQRTVLAGELPLENIGIDAATITRRLIAQVDMNEIRRALSQPT